MNSKVSALFGFLTGAIISGVTIWYYTKNKYAKIAQEEIDSVKKVYAQKKEQIKPDGESHDVTPTVLASNRIHEKADIEAYAKKLKDNNYISEYSKTVVPPKITPVAEENVDKADFPYVISPQEFGEFDDYMTVSLTCFEGNIVADEYGITVDVEEILGDALSHFGEYEDDSVYVRNDAKKCDYEILRSLDTYEEFLKTLPPI